MKHLYSPINLLFNPLDEVSSINELDSLSTITFSLSLSQCQREEDMF